MSLTNLIEAHIVDSLENKRDDADAQARREAFDASLEEHGQAEWQHARRTKPEQFWSAKVAIGVGPDGMLCEVDRDIFKDTARFRFEWRRAGKVERFDQNISSMLLMGEETYLREDDALRCMIGKVAFEIARHTGIPTTLSVRGNRAAFAEMQRREEQKQNAAPAREG